MKELGDTGVREPKAVAEGSVQPSYNIASAPSVVGPSKFISGESHVLQLEDRISCWKSVMRREDLRLSLSEAEMMELKSPNTHQGKMVLA